MRPFPQIRHRFPARPGGAYTALDIGPDGIVAVACGADRGSLTPACLRALPPGVITDGEVTSAEALAAELRELFADQSLPRDVRVGLAHSRLVVRTIEVAAALAGESLDAAVRHFAEGLLPMPLDEVALDYRPTGPVPGNPEQQRILIAAARLEGVARLMTALQIAGLHATKVSLCGLALLQALDAPPTGDEAVLYVQVGGLTNIVVAEHSEPVLVRVASAGSEAVSTTLAERANAPHVEGRSRAAAAGVTGSDALAASAVRDGLNRVVAEIHSSLEFYSSREEARPIGAAVITGAMTTWPGVAEALASEIGLTVLPAGRGGWAGIDIAGIAPEMLDVAVGLALQSDEDHPDLRPAVQMGPLGSQTAMPRTAGALCGVSAMLALAVVYLAIVSNQLSGNEDRETDKAAEAAKVEQQAAALAPYASFKTATETRRTAVAGVASSRFDWARVLRQLAERTPEGVWLTDVKGTLTPTTAVASGGGGGTGLRAVRLDPALELAGCALVESKVPDYMDRLRSIGRAKEVAFSESKRPDLSKDAKEGAGAGAGDCGKGTGDATAKFNLVTFFQTTGAAAAPADAAGQPTKAEAKP